MGATRTETQYAIRLKQSDGYRYEQYRDNGPGGTSYVAKLNLETAKKQLSLYTVTAEATVVVRTVVITEGDWEEVKTSEIKQLAELLHKKQCHFNHEDQCDWNYDDKRPVHRMYEGKAQLILEKMSFEGAKELLAIL